jgi:hypothetical protein
MSSLVILIIKSPQIYLLKTFGLRADIPHARRARFRGPAEKNASTTSLLEPTGFATASGNQAFWTAKAYYRNISLLAKNQAPYDG